MNRRPVRWMTLNTIAVVVILVAALLAAGCGGQVSSESGQKLKEKKEARAPDRVRISAPGATGEPIDELESEESSPVEGSDLNKYDKYADMKSISRELGFSINAPETILGGRFKYACVMHGALGTPEVTVTYTNDMHISMCRVDGPIDFEVHTAYYKELQEKTGMYPPEGTKYNPYAINVSGISVGVWPWYGKEGIISKIEWCPGNVLHKLWSSKEQQCTLNQLLDVMKSMTI